jgi:hypothetical protein
MKGSNKVLQRKNHFNGKKIKVSLLALLLFTVTGCKHPGTVKNYQQNTTPPQTNGKIIEENTKYTYPYIEDEYYIPQNNKNNHDNEVFRPNGPTPNNNEKVVEEKQEPITVQEQNVPPKTTTEPKPAPVPKPPAQTEPAPTPNPPTQTETNKYLLTDINSINKDLKDFGKFLGSGMHETYFKSVMDYRWQKVDPTGQIQQMSINLLKKNNYKYLEDFMRNLAKHDGVDLHIIGKSVEGRNIYSLSINFAPEKNNKVLMYAGHVHSNEYAGALFTLKMFDELITKAQTDEYTRLLLQNIRFEAVPIVSPDGYERLVNGSPTTWKSNHNGTDINRNFPSVNALQLAKGFDLTKYYSGESGQSFYAGPYLGSEPETRALMKWLHVYVPIAYSYLDMHQQGRGIYVGKPWETTQSRQFRRNYGQTLLSFLNAGVSSSNYIILSSLVPAADGFNGAGGTTPEYALSIAMGMEYCPKLGILALNEDGVLKSLMEFKTLEGNKYYKPINANFVAITLEIGAHVRSGSTITRNALGYTNTSREMMNTEYTRYNFDKLLKNQAEHALGKTKVEQLKEQAKNPIKQEEIIKEEIIEEPVILEEETSKEVSFLEQQEVSILASANKGKVLVKERIKTTT